MQMIGPIQRRQAVGPLLKLIPNAERPRGANPGRVRQILQVVRAGVGAAHHHRETVVDPQRIQPVDVEPIRVLGSDLRQHSRRIVVGSVLQNRGQGRSGVFGIQIDFVIEQSSVRQAAFRPRFRRRSTFCCRRCSRCCAMISPSTTCSVKFFDPTRMAELFDEHAARATSAVRAAIIFVRPIPIPSLPRARSMLPEPLLPESAPCPPTRRLER